MKKWQEVLEFVGWLAVAGGTLIGLLHMMRFARLGDEFHLVVTVPIVVGLICAVPISYSRLPPDDGAKTPPT